jgi:L-fucose mutarotase/ribose pyranase (RbsD/FucU family)
MMEMTMGLHGGEIVAVDTHWPAEIDQKSRAWFS